MININNGEAQQKSKGLKVMMMVSYDKKDRPPTPQPSVIIENEDGLNLVTINVKKRSNKMMASLERSNTLRTKGGKRFSSMLTLNKPLEKIKNSKRKVSVDEVDETTNSVHFEDHKTNPHSIQ